MRVFRGFLILALFAWPALAQELSFSGSIGMDFLFEFSTPASVSTALSLSMDVGKGGVQSQTILSLSGLEAQKLWLWLNFQGVTLQSGLLFNPCFSRWTLGVSGGCCPFFLGGWFYLGNLAGPCQTPSYTVGFVLDFGIGGEPGFLARSLTGFGVSNLYALIDADPWTDVELQPGWGFQEQLLHFAWSTDCLRLYTTWMFTSIGLGFGELGVSYRFPAPVVDLGGALHFNGSLALSWAKLHLGVTVDPVTIESATMFDFFGFLSQEIGIKIRFAQVFLYSATRFNNLLGLEWIKLGFELRF